MRERINRLAKGIIDSEAPRLVIAPQRVEGSVTAGSEARGEISVTSSNNLHIKGLAYSSNPRVTIVNSAFGGLRNRIAYEVNSEYCEHGDVIEGSFYLVTNGGEKEIPYSLRIQTGMAGEEMDAVKTADDFGRLAKRDWERALGLFEHQEFTEAPFMQDARNRAVYDGLKGRPGRGNLLEEFLVALGAKEPVRLSMDAKDRRYEALQAVTEDRLEVRSSGWGFVSVQAETDCPFIELLTTKVTNGDFLNGCVSIYYRIHPDRLHPGRNLGRIRVSSLKDSYTVAVEVNQERSGHRQERGLEEDHKRLYHYLSLRLDYETGAMEPQEALNAMAQQLEAVREHSREDCLGALLTAELFLMGGKREAAASILGEWSSVMASGEKDRETYCYFRYLDFCLEPTPAAKEGLIRLLKQSMERYGRPREALFFMLLKVDETLGQNPLELFLRMKSMYHEGCRSPFLYAAACRLLAEHLDLLVVLGDFEVQVLMFAARRGILTAEASRRAAGLAGELRHYRRIYERLLERMYERYPSREALEALCGLLIRGEQKGPQAFCWYERALKERLNLTRLYEYFLYSLPEDYGRLLPKEVLLYFSYAKDLDDQSRCVLYRNILEYMDPSQELYQSYLRRMEQFAMEQMFASRINSSLAVIYGRMIYKDMIDRRAARVLPGVLRSYRICCGDSRMKYVIVRCEELAEEAAYPLKEGTAYVPIYSDHLVLMFQDAYGSRYMDVGYSMTPVMEKPELLAKCYEMDPEHPMLRLRECARLLEEGLSDTSQAAFVEQLMEELSLNPVYRARLSALVTDYYCRKAAEGQDGAFDCAYLVQMDKERLGAGERRRICQTLISQNYMREAYDMVCRYGAEGLDAQSRMRLCGKMILQSLFGQDDRLLSLAYSAFKEGCCDSVILDYLCEHFNGTVSQMYEVLIRGVEERVETYDLEERLLAQMMFTGSTEQIDSVFQLYVTRKKPRESVVRAYFTEKSVEYFLEERPASPAVFQYLESAIGRSIEKDRIPTIYLLALTRYYASQEVLKEEQRRLCRLIGGLLIGEGLVFPYTRELSRHMPVPEDIMDKAMVEYHGRKDARPELLTRILPGDGGFKNEEMRRVYQGIFVKQKVLFEGESMEYQIYDYIDGRRVLAASGTVSCDHKLDGKENSRFALLNKMGTALKEKDEAALKAAMEDYLKKAAVLSKLFPVK